MNDSNLLRFGDLNQNITFDDFNEYVNGKWIKNTKIPADKSEWNTFHIVYEDNIDKITKILQKLALDTNNKHNVIGKLFERLVSNKNSKSSQSNLNELKKKLKEVDTINTLEDMGRILGHLTKIDINPFFQTSASEDPKNTKYVKFIMWSPNLSMPEKGYYTKVEFKHYVSELEENIDSVFNFVYGQNDAKYAKNIIMIETFIAHALKSIEVQRDIEKMYHKTNMKHFFGSVSDALLKQKNISSTKTNDSIKFWSAYFDIALQKNINDFIIYDISFFRKLSIMLSMLPIEKLKEYIKYAIIKSTEKTLIPELDNILFNFFDKKLQGQQYPTQNAKLIIEILSKNIGDVISKEYVDTYFDESSKDMVNEMVQNIIKQMFISINNLDWMTTKTKDNAILKLKKFRVKIGYPDTWKNRDDLLVLLNNIIDHTSLYELINVIKKYNYNKFMINLIDKSQDPEKWSMNPHEVNAYYDPQRNEIVFPAGILDAPFFDKNQSLGTNYGGIGTIIGHEITHGYDDQGRKFDQDGNFSNQWSKSDITKYEMIAEKMVKQYDNYIIENRNVNGKLTLGENIADLGGVVLAFRALCEKLSMFNLSDESIKKEKRDFFISYARLWKNVTNPEKILSLLLSNPHSPSKFRVWVVRNVDDFYEIFKNQVVIDGPGSMFLPPNDRVTIW